MMLSGGLSCDVGIILDFTASAVFVGIPISVTLRSTAKCLAKQAGFKLLLLAVGEEDVGFAVIVASKVFFVCCPLAYYHSPTGWLAGSFPWLKREEPGMATWGSLPYTGPHLARVNKATPGFKRQFWDLNSHLGAKQATRPADIPGGLRVNEHTDMTKLTLLGDSPI